MIDLLSFITSTLGRRQQASQFDKNLAEEQAQRAQQESQFSRNYGLDQNRLTQQESQFARNYGLDEKKLAEAKLDSEANRKLQQQQLLASIADKFNSPDVLNLLGNQLGVPGLGYRTTFNNASSSRTTPGIAAYNPQPEPSLYDRSMQRIRDFLSRSNWPS